MAPAHAPWCDHPNAICSTWAPTRHALPATKRVCARPLRRTGLLAERNDRSARARMPHHLRSHPVHLADQIRLEDVVEGSDGAYPSILHHDHVVAIAVSYTHLRAHETVLD